MEYETLMGGKLGTGNSLGASLVMIEQLKTLLSNRLVAVSVDGEPAADNSALTGDSEISVGVGVGSSTVIDGEPYYLVGFEAPKENTPAAAALRASAAKLGCAELLDRLTTGWIESTAERRELHVLAVPAPDDTTFTALANTLIAIDAWDGKSANARLHTAGQLPVAPTRGYVNLGTDQTPKVVSWANLFGLSVVLDDLSTEKGNGRFVYDVRANDTATNAIRDRYNRGASVADIQQRLEESGWARDTADDSNAVTRFTRGAEYGLLTHGTRVFIRSDEPALTSGDRQMLTYFDLLVGTEQNGCHLDSPEAAAQWLFDEDHLRPETVSFTAQGDAEGRLPEISISQETRVVIAKATESVRDARSRHSVNEPLAFLKTVDGRPDAVVSITPSGRTVRWQSLTSHRTLLNACAQFIRGFKKDKDGKVVGVEYAHSIPDALVDAISRNLLEPGQLKPLEIITNQPVLVSTGKGRGVVVRTPGYNPAAKAFLAMPPRDLSKWVTEYEVPENPTLEDAIQAYAYLMDEVLHDFPFATPRDKHRAMAYLLTCCGRTLTTGAPGFIFNAPTRGSGKSLLALIGRILALGYAVFQGFKYGNDREIYNNMVALLLSGGTFLHNDEVPMGSTMRSETIQEAITEVDGFGGGMRILGGNEKVQRKGLIITACGNNVQLGGDLNRRFLNIQLEYQGAGPLTVQDSERKHPKLIKWVIENRQSLVAAAHTVLLYGLQHPTENHPHIKHNHDWDEVVLGAMSYIPAGGTNAAEMSMDGWLEEVAAADENGEQWGELLAHLWAEAGHRRSLAKELVRYTTVLSVTRKTGGHKLPDVPDELRPWNPKDPKAGATFATKAKAIIGTPIPYEGFTYKLRKEPKPKGDTNPTRYMLECFGPDGKLVNPPEGIPMEKLRQFDAANQ